MGRRARNLPRASAFPMMGTRGSYAGRPEDGRTIPPSAQRGSSVSVWISQKADMQRVAVSRSRPASVHSGGGSMGQATSPWHKRGHPDRPTSRYVRSPGRHATRPPSASRGGKKKLIGVSCGLPWECPFARSITRLGHRNRTDRPGSGPIRSIRLPVDAVQPGQASPLKANGDVDRGNASVDCHQPLR